MWISKRKYQEITARLDELERATSMHGPGYGIRIGVLVGLLMDHLKVYPWESTPRVELRQKEGPERVE